MPFLNNDFFRNLGGGFGKNPFNSNPFGEQANTQGGADFLGGAQSSFRPGVGNFNPFEFLQPGGANFLSSQVTAPPATQVTSNFQAPGPPDNVPPGFDPNDPFNPEPPPSNNPPPPVAEPLGNFAQFVQGLRGLTRGDQTDSSGGLQGLIDLINEFGFADNIFGGRVSERVLRHARRLAPDRFGGVSDTVALDRLARLLGLPATGQGALFNDDGTPRSGGALAEGGSGVSGGGEGLSGFGDDTGGAGSSTDFIQRLEGVVRGLLSQQFGLPPDFLNQQRNSILTRGAQREQQGLRNLQGVFNTAGQLGGGQFANQADEFTGSVNDAVANALLGLEAQNTQFGLQGRQQALSTALGVGDLGLRQLLGQGQLSLGQGQLNIQNQQFLANLALQEWLLRNRSLGQPG